METVLKTVVGQLTVGSNPTPSAKACFTLQYTPVRRGTQVVEGVGLLNQ